MADRHKNRTKAENDFKFDYNNDAGKIGARMMADRHKNLAKEERERTNSYFLVFQMYWEKDTIQRLQRLQEKLADKNMIFKFNGDRFAIFSMNQFERTQYTDYTLSLKDVEDFAEKA